MAINQRRKYFIKRAFQLRYASVILFFIFITMVISSSAIYLAIFPFLSEKLANVYPQARLVGILRNANMKAILSTAVILPIAAWIGIILSHRIAGPWYRMEVILREIAEGSLISDVQLRKGDELQSLADAVNKVTSNLRAMSHENIGYLRSLDETLVDFEEVISHEPVDVMKAKLLISKIQEASKELKNSLHRHKLE